MAHHAQALSLHYPDPGLPAPSLASNAHLDFVVFLSSGSLPPSYLNAPDPSQARVPPSPISLKKYLLTIHPANL